MLIPLCGVETEKSLESSDRMQSFTAAFEQKDEKEKQNMTSGASRL